MKSFNYLSPKTIIEALDILKDADEDTHIIAGGTDVILNMHSGRIKPKTVVNINKIDELKYIKTEDGVVKIGAVTTFTELGENEFVNNRIKVLANACREVGSTQIRNLGTIGGNIVNASPAADSASALTALDASVVLRSKDGDRKMKLVDFYDNGKSKLKKDEILTEISFKEPNENTATCFTRLVKRRALAIVVLSMGALIEKDELNKCIKAQFSLGAVSRHPIRLYDIEKKIIGKDLNKENLDELLDDMSEIIYKIILEGSAKRLGSANYKSKSIRGVAGETFDNILSDFNIQ